MKEINDFAEELKGLLIDGGIKQINEQFAKGLSDNESILKDVDIKVGKANDTYKPSYYLVDTDSGEVDLFTMYDRLFGKKQAGLIALASAFKYIRRAGFKDPSKSLEDFKKAITCIDEYSKRKKGE